MRTHLVLTLLLAVAPWLAAAIDPAALAAARELYGQRNDDAALAAYQQLAAADPAAAEPQFYLGLLAMRRDDAPAAAAFLEKAVALDPANGEYHRRLGDAYGRSAQKAGMFSKLGWARKSLAAYERAVALEPASVEARASLMAYYQQAPAIAGGGLDKARAQADEIRKLDDLRGRIAQAGLHVAAGRPADAFALFEEVLRDNPDDYAALFQVGRLAAVTGERLDSGAAALRRCLALTPPAGQPGHAAAHWRLGMIQQKQGNKPAARASYEAALATDAKFAPAQAALRALD